MPFIAGVLDNAIDFRHVPGMAAFYLDEVFTLLEQFNDL